MPSRVCARPGVVADVLASPLTDGPDGRVYNVPMTETDVLACIAQLPHGWPDIVKRIYNGEDLRRIWASQSRYSWGEFRDGVSMAMGSLEILMRRRADRKLGRNPGPLPGGRDLQPDLFQKWEGIAERD
jgi:hypothetical protein